MQLLESPRLLDPQILVAYQTVVKRVPRIDWDGLQTRVNAAIELATKAFVDKEREAWEIVQVIEWRLQRQSCLRPTEPGDVYVLDTLYAIEESTLPSEEIPQNLSAHEFCTMLKQDVLCYSAVDSELMQLIRSGGLTYEDWKYLCYQWLPSTIDFTRSIALASLTLPRQQARLMYQNLFDEVGRGDWEHSHFMQMQRLLNQFDIDATDEEEMLAWTVPEMIAMTNAQNRMLWHAEPGWALGAMFLCEQLIPGDLSAIGEALALMNLPAESLEYFHEHIEIDVEHSAEWLGIIENLLLESDSQKIVYRAAMQQGQNQRIAWDAALAGWQQWKGSGIRRHLPVAELSLASN